MRNTTECIGCCRPAGKEERPVMYYIQDTRNYVGNCMLFWRKNHSGYTPNINEAGLYTEEQARRICRNRSTDIAWKEDYIRAHLQLVCDAQYISREEAEKF
jgi:hypothetical protein